MTLHTRMAPTAPIARVQNQFDRILETSMNTAMMPVAMPLHGPVMPMLNVYEDVDCIIVEAELPGVPLDDVDVTVIGNQLTITGRRTLLIPEEAAIVSKERGSLKFHRTVVLPAMVREEGILASMRKGILTVSLPRIDAIIDRRFPMA